MGYNGGYNIMTTLEIVLIAIMWIGYGLFAAYQTSAYKDNKEFLYFLYPTISPIILVAKMIYGAFKKYDL